MGEVFIVHGGHQRQEGLERASRDPVARGVGVEGLEQDRPLAAERAVETVVAEPPPGVPIEAGIVRKVGVLGRLGGFDQLRRVRFLPDQVGEPVVEPFPL